MVKGNVDLPQRHKTPRMTHAVHSGRYLIRTRARRDESMMRNACCSLIGAFQKMQIIAVVPKFHTNTANVM